MPHYRGMDPLLNQSLFCHRFDAAVNGLVCEFLFFVRAMLPKGVEDRMIRVRPIPGSLQVVVNGEKDIGL
jgi:hypothetical protein